MANQSIQQISCTICEISHAMKNTFVAFYVNRNCSLRIRIRRRNDPINISTWLLSRIMNSARLCIREMRGFERFHIGGRRRYISSLGTHSSQTRARGVMQASCARANRRNSRLLFSFRGFRNSSSGEGTWLKVTWYCRRRLTSAFHPVAGTLSRILRV